MPAIEDHLPPPLAAALDRLAEAVGVLQDAWWIFGGAALALHDLPDLVVPDVDVLASRRDAERLTLALGGAQTSPAPGHFQSSYLGRVPGELPIEVMSDLAVRSEAGWRPVAFSTRVSIAWRGGALFTPSLEEHAAIYRLFGRPKDLVRAGQLDAALGSR